ncbi:hypothetical protein D3C84_1157140 [compost metagenome]
MDGGFSDAIHVDQLRRLVAETFEPGAQALHINGFAAKNDLAQPVAKRLMRLAGDLQQRPER